MNSSHYDRHQTISIKQLSDHLDEAIGQGSANNAEWMLGIKESIQAKEVQTMDDLFLQDKQVNGGQGIFEDERIIWD